MNDKREGRGNACVGGTTKAWDMHAQPDNGIDATCMMQIVIRDVTAHCHRGSRCKRCATIGRCRHETLATSNQESDVP